MEVETHKTLSSSFNLQSKPPFSFPLNGISRSDLHPPKSPISAISDSASAGTREANFSDFSSGKSSLKVDMVACDDAVPAVDEKVNGCRSPVMDGNFESSAVLRMQKVYRGYRTRRKLADSAVVAEELWWQAIDYARLNHSTISFFNFAKPESASSRWNRIVSNASKVGKGLSKDVNAQKLAFQHWIEAIDPRHRYGHSLHFYYEEWCKTDAGQPFFYWLDVGEGKDLNLKECPRSKLRQQCIKYLGPQEREHYEYVFEEGKVIHQQTGTLLDTNKGVKMIFVMSTTKKLYAGEKKKGLFHHSSFLAGGATLAAGRLEAENGVLKSISPYSGHYRPSDDSLDIFLSVLREYGVDLDEVQVNKASEDSEIYDDGKPNVGELKVEVPTISKAIELEISDQEDKSQTSELTETIQTQTKNSYQRQLSGGLRSPKADVPKTAILQRINSKKAAKSYQLGHQLSLKWTTGAGPRIGCVADYPIEVRKQALEFVSLSPRLPTTPSAFRLAAQSGLASPSADATCSS